MTISDSSHVFPWNRGTLSLVGTIIATLLIPLACTLLVGLVLAGASSISPGLHSALESGNNLITTFLWAMSYTLGSMAAILWLRRRCGGGSILALIRGRRQDFEGKIGKTIALGVIGSIVAMALKYGYDTMVAPLLFHAAAAGTAITTPSLVGAALVLFIIQAVVTAPILEETVARGLVYNMAGATVEKNWPDSLKRLSPYIAAIVSATFFAATHFSLIAFVPHLMFGLVAAEVYRRSGNIGASVLMHSINNAAAALFLIL